MHKKRTSTNVYKRLYFIHVPTVVICVSLCCTMKAFPVQLYVIFTISSYHNSSHSRFLLWRVKYYVTHINSSFSVALHLSTLSGTCVNWHLLRPVINIFHEEYTIHHRRYIYPISWNVCRAYAWGIVEAYKISERLLLT